MRNDIDEAYKRLELARKDTALKPNQRSVLCDIIAAEINDTLGNCYSDIPIQVYHHPLCTGYSSTTIKRLIEQSYNHWFVGKNEQTSSLRFGSAFHAFCDEPHVFDQEYLVVPTIDKKSAEWRAAKKTVRDKILLTSGEFKSIEVMSRKLYEHPDAGPLVKGALNEITYFSKDSATGLWKKCRVDKIKNRAVADLKSTRSADAISFSFDSKKFLYRISASYYLEIISEVTGIRHTDFYLIPCETTEPYECAVYRVSDHSIEKAQSEIRQALGIIRTVLDEGDSAWRGYPIGIREISI